MANYIVPKGAFGEIIRQRAIKMLKSYGLANIPKPSALLGSATEGMSAEQLADMDSVMPKPLRPLQFRGKVLNFAPIQWDAIKKHFGEKVVALVQAEYKKDKEFITNFQKQRVEKAQESWETQQADFEKQYESAMKVIKEVREKVHPIIKAKIAEVEAQKAEIDFAYLDHIVTLKPQYLEEAVAKYFETRLNFEEYAETTTLFPTESIAAIKASPEYKNWPRQEIDVADMIRLVNDSTTSKKMMEKIIAEEDAKFFTPKEHH